MQTPITTVPVAVTGSEQVALGRLAGSLVNACPDLRQMAREIAQSILLKHANSHIEPDSVYWHRFNDAQSSPRTFTGWQHLGQPVQSLTLPQLVMQRFNPHDQNATDELQQMSGFYTVDSHAEYFDERNEVRLLPQDALAEFWAIDFRTRYFDRLNTFWQDKPEDFRALTKANFISKALENRANGWLSANDHQMLMQAIGLDLAHPVSLEVLRARAPLPSDVQICTFDIAGYRATDILRIVQASGRQLLYIPGELQTFHAFDTPEDLHWWLLSQTNQAENRTRFMSHFAQASHPETEGHVGLHHSLDLLFSTWGAPGPSLINRNSHPLTGDAFDHLRDAAKTRMFADADSSLQSNDDLRRQMWIGYLGAFSRVFGPLAALDWPIALAVVGAGLAETGLNVDQAINGHTTAERKVGVIGAVLSGIDTLFNSTLLIHAEVELPGPDTLEEADIASSPTATAEVPTALEPEPELEQLVPGPVYPVQRDDLLAPFETNAILDAAEPVQTEGKMKGVYLQNDGSTYICINTQPYAVRYVEQLQSWLIIDPQNPFSFYRNLPVRRTESGIWEPVTRPGLRGGGKGLSKLSWGRSAHMPPQMAPLASPYDIPENLRSPLLDAAQNEECKYFDGFRHLSPEDNAPYDTFEAIRDQLREDADAFYAAVEIPPRPPLPDISPETSARQFLQRNFDITSGLVIGESHDGIGSKQLLIDNMPQLARLKVKTLYLEHLLTDFHQADLDAFARSGRMSPALRNYILNLDNGHATDSSGRYTFMNLIKTANNNRIRIQAIDCMASYRIRDLDNPAGTLRQKLMNFFANSVIRANQARIGGGRWVALVGNSHANNFNGIPGIAELEEATGLRVEDVTRGTPAGFDADPGFDIQQIPNRLTVVVKSDVRLRAAIKPVLPVPVAAEQRLKNVGDFSIQQVDTSLALIHHSREGSLVSTPIHVENNHYYLLNPKWSQVSGRRFDSLAQLSLALKNMGLKEVA